MLRTLLLAALIAAPVTGFAGTSQTVVLDVQNMMCDLCPITVKKALGKVPGVVEAKVDLGTKSATVTFDADKANVATLVKATTDAGFPSKVHQ